MSWRSGELAGPVPEGPSEASRRRREIAASGVEGFVWVSVVVDLPGPFGASKPTTVRRSLVDVRTGEVLDDVWLDDVGAVRSWSRAARSAAAVSPGPTTAPGASVPSASWGSRTGRVRRGGRAGAPRGARPAAAPT